MVSGDERPDAGTGGGQPQARAVRSRTAEYRLVRRRAMMQGTDTAVPVRESSTTPAPRPDAGADGALSDGTLTDVTLARGELGAAMWGDVAVKGDDAVKSDEAVKGDGVPRDKDADAAVPGGEAPRAGGRPEAGGGSGGAATGRVRVIRARPTPQGRPRPSPVGRSGGTTAGGSTARDDGSTGGTGGSAKKARRLAPAGSQVQRVQMLAGVLAVVVVAGLVAIGLVGRSWQDQRQLDDARQAALAAARQTTVNFVSISASTVDRDLKRIENGATGQFKDEFTRDTSQVRAAVVANKVDSKGTVLRAAVVSGNLHTAVVLVAIDATVKNTGSPNGRLSHYRVQVNLSRGASGRWLVSQLQFVG